jgi:hypothetical protein
MLLSSDERTDASAKKRSDAEHCGRLQISDVLLLELLGLKRREIDVPLRIARDLVGHYFTA